MTLQKPKSFRGIAGGWIPLLLLTVSLAAVSTAAPLPDEKALIALLESDAPKAEKAIACKQLAVKGSKDAVAAIAPLLRDEQLCSWARIPLEAIPGSEATAALVDAADEVKGRQLLGVINSLGVRKDAAGAPLLTELVKEEGAAGDAAIVALAKIAAPGAAETVLAELQTESASRLDAAAEAAILLAEKQEDLAAKLYLAVNDSGAPKQRQLEAMRGRILSGGDAGMMLLGTQLRSGDKKDFYLGLQTAREMSDDEAVAETLAAAVLNVPAARGAVVLLALGDSGQPVPADLLSKCLTAEAKPLRIAALEAVSQSGNAESVPSLIDLAGTDDADLSSAAVQALIDLSGDDVNSAIASRLASASETELAILMPVIGARRITATAVLTKALASEDGAVRAAALAALGETVGSADLGVLVKEVAAAKTEEARAAAKKALQTAAVRMPDPEATGKSIVAALADQSLETKTSLLEVLGATGSQTSLSALGNAAKSEEVALQDAGTRLLGKWMNVDAGPTLLEVAAIDGHAYQIRAIRGYIRLARQFAKSDEQRAEMCSKALAAATRATEQRLVLETARGYPSLPMLEVAIAAAESPELKSEAVTTALLIAQKVNGSKKEAVKLLAKIGQEPVELEVVSAKYGSDSKNIDVTEILRKQASDLPLILLPYSSFNQSFGSDPAPGQVKRLQVNYKLNGEAGEVSVAEDAPIFLPKP